MKRCEEGTMEGRYGDRYSPIERYVPGGGPRYDRGYPPRFMDPYSGRDLFQAPPPPQRYLRPIHRYTPRPTRIEYRTHVEYLGSSGGRSVQTDFSPADAGCVDLYDTHPGEPLAPAPEDLFRTTPQHLYLNTSRTTAPRDREPPPPPLNQYVRTPPLGRETDRRVVESGNVPNTAPLSLCCSSRRSATAGLSVPPPSVQQQQQQPPPPPQPTQAPQSQQQQQQQLPPPQQQQQTQQQQTQPQPQQPPPPQPQTHLHQQHPSSIWRTVSQAPSPPSPSPSPPSQATTSTPPSVLDSGVYSRSGPSSEAPSTCSTGAGSCVASGGSPQVVARTQNEDPTVDTVTSEHQQQQQHQRRLIQQAIDRQQSMPVTQAELAANAQQRAFLRNNSWSEVVKKALKKNAAQFFGVDEVTEEKEKHIWLGRRKRLASRRCGDLKPEYREQPIAAQVNSRVQGLQPDILPSVAGSRDETDFSWQELAANVRQKPSVVSMACKGVALFAAALNKHRSRDSLARRRKTTSRSYSPSTVGGASPLPQSPLDDEVFFDRTSGTETVLVPPAPPPADFTDSNSELLGPHTQERTRERHGSWKRAAGEGKREGSVTQIGLGRISSVDLDKAHDNSDRRQFGQGFIPRLFGKSLKRSVMSREPVKEVLEDLEDHRPFFTYWLSTVQILILVISLVSYGFGPFGVDLNHQSGLVLVTSLSLQQVDYTEPANFWLGPRPADLIHLGAKFAPCMRRDAKIMKEIEKGREKERETACCIRNDDSGCVQSSKSDCSATISTWKKWSHNERSGGRISGSVCGLDPKYCEAPASVAPYEWPDDITKWPICRKTSSPLQRARPKDKLAAEHMVCEVIGHPCCIGIHATCRITTKEYCDFVHGHFHDEASLCSQVSCLDNVCGMLPFFNSEVPDQFYRLLTSLFLHAGVIQLAISLSIQWFVMRDVEKLTGTLRLIILYLGSGVAGNLASAIFVPYRADVGPAGANSGLLACLIVEILNLWPMLQHPYCALFKHLSIALVLFIIGLLPWIDNFSSFFGFIFGFLLSYAILPYVSVGEYERQKKIFLIWVCLITTVFLFLLLLIFFYIIPVYDCEICGYFNCLPLTRDFCSTQNINFKRNDGV